MVYGRFARPGTRWRVLIQDFRVPDDGQEARFAFCLKPFVHRTEIFRAQLCQRVKDLERHICDRHALKTLEEKEAGVNMLRDFVCFRDVGITDRLEREEHPSREDVEKSPVGVSTRIACNC